MFKSFLKKKPFILGSLFVFGVIVFSITLFLAKQQQETRSHAEKTVDLFYQPSSDQAPLQLPAGSTFTLDVYLDPGSNSVSYVKVEMDYDQTKFKPAGGFIPNSDVFSQTVEGPIDLPGKTVVTLSIGSDLSKAVKVRTKIGTLALKAIDTVATNTTSTISFGSDSQALSVSNNSSFNENVIASTTPVTVQINKPQLTCGTSPSDVMLVMDRSGSMNDKAGSTGTKLSNAKAAANNFLSIISAQEANRAGLVSFGSDGTLVNPLTNDFPTLKNQVNAITISGETCVSCGITKANQEIALHKRNAKNVVILLTDGRANHIEGSKSFVSEATADKYALAAAVSGHIANGTIFYTIGLGKDVDSKFLTQLAESTGGLYYFSPTTDQLNDIYTQISQILAKGSITGTVFNDANQNGVFEPTEPGIPGVLLQLYPYGMSTPQLISTDSNGTYTIQNLCDRIFTIKQVVPSKWRQTLPLDLRGYTFTISNGSAIADKNFGDTRVPRCSDGVDNDGNGATDSKDSTCHTDGNPNNPGSYDPNRDGEHGNSTCTDSQDNNGNGLIDGEDPVCHIDGIANNPSSYDPTRDEAAIPTVTPTPTMTPTPTSEPTATPTVAPTETPSPTQIPTSPTPIPAGTRISVDVLLHGIGNSGDNANPNANSLSNKSPIHTKRVATVWLYDINNNLTATASGDIQYSSTSGSFTGIVYASSLIPSGNYSAKLNTGNHLTRLVAGIQNIVTDQTNSLPITDVVAGDVNNDNRLDILDYNLLLGCYSDLSPALSCTDQNKIFADLNDDGGVNQFDYNLFLREISTQPGQ